MKNTYMTVRKIIGHDVPLFYPIFSGRITTHTYASNMNLGRVTSGKGISLKFYLFK